MPKQTKLAVSERAVVQRINRKLAPERKLCKSRSVRMSIDVGQWFVVNCRINGVQLKDVDVPSLAKELGVLREWETVKA